MLTLMTCKREKDIERINAKKPDRNQESQYIPVAVQLHLKLKRGKNERTNSKSYINDMNKYPHAVNKEKKGAMHQRYMAPGYSF